MLPLIIILCSATTCRSAGWITTFKLHSAFATPSQCQNDGGNQQGLISSQPVADSAGECPRPMLCASGFWSGQTEQQFFSLPARWRCAPRCCRTAGKTLLETWMKRRLTRIEHLGSYACRNVTPGCARRSEHASAEALDVSGFRSQMAENHCSTAQRLRRQETGPRLRIC